MKKLMVAIAAVASAFGAFASGDTGTAFEPNPQAELTYVWNNNTFTPGYWTGYEANTAKIAQVSHGQVAGKNDNRPDVFVNANENDEQVLEIASTLGNPVTLKTETSGNGVSINKNFYFDGLVNLTVFDSDAEPGIGDAKFAMYLQAANEEESATNLIVCAGGTTYTCAEDSAELFTPGWHRITIRAIENIYQTGTAVGFVVYVDGSAVTCEAAKIDDTSDLTPLALALNDGEKLFVANGDYDATIKSIGFDGKGFVDELVFTENDPGFIKDPNVAKITWTSEGIAKVTVDGEEYTASPAFGVVTAGKVHVVWTAKSGWVSGEADVDAVSGATVSIDSLIKPAVAKIGGKSYATIDEAVKDAVFGNTIELITDATAEKEVLVVAAGVTLDLAGNTLTGNVTSENLQLDNSDTENDAAIDGYFDIIDGKILKTNIKFDYAANFDEANNKCAINKDFLPEGYEFVAEGTAWWVPALIKTYALSVATSITGGTVEINPVAGSYAAGTEVTVTTKPNAGYTFVTITTNGQALASNTFLMPADAVVVSAMFEANVYTVTVDCTDKHCKAAFDPANAQGGLGETVQITLTPDQNYEFAADSYTGWTKEGDVLKRTHVIEDGSNALTAPAATEKQQDWPDPGTVDPNTPASSKLPGLVGDSLANADLKDLATWAKDYDVEFDADAVIAAKNAFLLNCAPADAEDEMKAYNVTAITQDASGNWVVTPRATNTKDVPYYGKPVIQSTESIETPAWTDGEAGPFFRTQLRVKAVVTP